jgi:hypothetical protein
MRDTRINANSNLTCVNFEVEKKKNLNFSLLIVLFRKKIPNKYTLLNKIDYVTDHIVPDRLLLL